MSSYYEYEGKIAFHPGYYIKEIIDESGLTQEDFAKRLDTTPKNLSLLLRGEQSLSVDIAKKLSRMLGTSIKYWLNLQNAYDALIAEFESNMEMEEERKVFKYIDYTYLRDNFGLPNLPRKIDQQIIETRRLLGLSSLTVLSRNDLAVNFRNPSGELLESNRVRANTMVQIAINEALKIDAPRFDMNQFENAVEKTLTMTTNHENFFPLICDLFLEAGVVLRIMPNMKGSKINGATKKIGSKVLLMVNDRGVYADSFWFTLFHEIGHIMAGDFGASMEGDSGTQEDAANEFAKDSLIPPKAYERFVHYGRLTRKDVIAFANQIDRDPGIVVGRMFNDGIKDYTNKELNSLRVKYKVIC